MLGSGAECVFAARVHPGPSWSIPVSNITENLSNFVGDLDPLLLDLADDASDGWSCLRSERRFGASRREGSLSARVHTHDGLLGGRGVGCLALSRTPQLE